jgi:hypothetical protein
MLAAGYKWVWDRGVVVYHPMDLSEYLNHLRWWAQSAPVMRELIDQVRTYSLFRIYCRKVYSILKSFQEGVTISLNAHAALLFLRPMFQVVAETRQLKELKKVLRKK